MNIWQKIARFFGIQYVLVDEPKYYGLSICRVHKVGNRRFVNFKGDLCELMSSGNVRGKGHLDEPSMRWEPIE